MAPSCSIELRGGRRRAQLEDRLRELVRDGTLAAGSRLPSSRALADDLEVSRRLVVDAYAQLLAEGYLVARHGRGHVRRGDRAASRTACSSERRRRRRSFDFFPGAPDLASLPARAVVARAARRAALGAAERVRLPRRARRSRAAARARPRTCGACAASSSSPTRSSICAGATQGLALLGRALARRGLARDRRRGPGPATAPRGARLRRPARCAGERRSTRTGLDVGARRARRAVLATPAHQCPTGVVLSPRRRGELIQWARAGGLVIEDDYDAEFRYDRAPLASAAGPGARSRGVSGDRLQDARSGAAARAGWFCPASLIDGVVEAKLLDDLGSSTIEQLALARLLETAAYDRHLRKARRRNRDRRDALIAAVAGAHPAGAGQRHLGRAARARAPAAAPSMSQRCCSARRRALAGRLSAQPAHDRSARARPTRSSSATATCPSPRSQRASAGWRRRWTSSRETGRR